MSSPQGLAESPWDQSHELQRHNHGSKVRRLDGRDFLELTSGCASGNAQKSSRRKLYILGVGRKYNFILDTVNFQHKLLAYTAHSFHR